jgi:hypothetical protein
MKVSWMLILLLVFGFMGLPVSAQDSELITLDDATPSVDVAISLPADTTGTIALDLSLAAVTLVSEAGDVVFQTADARVHGLELNIAPNSGAHTLTAARLPGVSLASVRVRSLAALTSSGAAESMDTTELTLNQARLMTADISESSTHISIPQGDPGVITVSYPGTASALHITDGNGASVLTATRDIDGVNLVVDSGEYDVALQAETAQSEAQVGVQVAQAVQFTVLPVPTATAAAPAPQPETVTAACQATVEPLAVYFHSGPGEGYSILGNGYRDQVYPVGGINPQANWLVVGTGIGGVWAASDNVRLSGNCAALTVYDMPLLESQPVQIAPSFRGDDHDENEHEESEGFEHEGDD